MASRRTINPFHVFMSKLPKPLRNKYVLALLIFAILMIFLDRHDLLTQFRLGKSLNRLEHDKTYYEEKIKEAKQDQQNVQNNKEKFAREKYNMHKKDEDVYVIPDEK